MALSGQICITHYDHIAQVMHMLNTPRFTRKHDKQEAQLLLEWTTLFVTLIQITPKATQGQCSG